jgi:transposase
LEIARARFPHSHSPGDDTRKSGNPKAGFPLSLGCCFSYYKLRKEIPLKAKVAVEAIKAHKTTAQIAQMFGVHPTQVGGWKKQALAGLPDVFGNGREQMRQQADAEKDELYKQIGQLKVELDFLKKRAGLID